MKVKNRAKEWMPLGRDGIDGGAIVDVPDSVALSPRALALSVDNGGPLEIPYVETPPDVPAPAVTAPTPAPAPVGEAPVAVVEIAPPAPNKDTKDKDKKDKKKDTPT